MPSSPNYKRDLKQEYATQKRRGESGTGSNSDNAKRHKARALALKLGMIKKGDKRDIDHKRPLSKGGGNTKANLRAVSKHANRSYPRKADGSMK